MHSQGSKAAATINCSFDAVTLAGQSVLTTSVYSCGAPAGTSLRPDSFQLSQVG